MTQKYSYSETAADQGDDREQLEDGTAEKTDVTLGQLSELSEPSLATTGGDKGLVMLLMTNRDVASKPSAHLKDSTSVRPVDNQRLGFHPFKTIVTTTVSGSRQSAHFYTDMLIDSLEFFFSLFPLLVHMCYINAETLK